MVTLLTLYVTYFFNLDVCRTFLFVCLLCSKLLQWCMLVRLLGPFQSGNLYHSLWSNIFCSSSLKISFLQFSCFLSFCILYSLILDIWDDFLIFLYFLCFLLFSFYFWKISLTLSSNYIIECFIFTVIKKISKSSLLGTWKDAQQW